MADKKIFTDEEIAEIMKLLDATRRTQYIGARYVPIFGRRGETSVEWDDTAPYEPLTIVLHQGNSYTSRQYVPAGVGVNDERYWAQTGNYNAQVEAYRNEVRQYDARITANAAAAAAAQETADSAQSAAAAAQGTADSAQRAADEAQSAADNAQSTADSAKKAAGEAQSAADNAQSTADTAVSANGLLKLGLNDTRYGRGTHAVFVGDSITEGWNGSNSTAGGFVTPLCQHYGWTKHNYAVGGTGFNPVNTNNFKAQADRAAADASYDHANVSHVFVSGGINDGEPDRNATDIYVENARATVSTLRTAFPNARIVVVVGLCAVMDGRKHGTAAGPINQRVPYFTALERGLDDIGVTVVQGWRWLLTNTTYCDDGLHPNNAGYNILMGMYCGLVEGLPLNPCVADAMPAYNITAESRAPLAIQGAIMYGVDTAHVFGTLKYTRKRATAAPEGDVINAHDVSLIMGYLPPHMRCTFNTFFPVLVHINGRIDWGYIEIQPAKAKKDLTALRLHYTKNDYDMTANDWNLEVFVSHTLPIVGVRS